MKRECFERSIKDESYMKMPEEFIVEIVEKYLEGFDFKDLEKKLNSDPSSKINYVVCGKIRQEVKSNKIPTNLSVTYSGELVGTICIKIVPVIVSEK